MALFDFIEFTSDFDFKPNVIDDGAIFGICADAEDAKQVRFPIARLNKANQVVRGHFIAIGIVSIKKGLPIVGDNPIDGVERLSRKFVKMHKVAYPTPQRIGEGNRDNVPRAINEFRNVLDDCALGMPCGEAENDMDMPSLKGAILQEIVIVLDSPVLNAFGNGCRFKARDNAGEGDIVIAIIDMTFDNNIEVTLLQGFLILFSHKFKKPRMGGFSFRLLVFDYLKGEGGKDAGIFGERWADSDKVAIMLNVEVPASLLFSIFSDIVVFFLIKVHRFNSCAIVDASHNGLYVNPSQEPYLFQLGQHRGHYAKHRINRINGCKVLCKFSKAICARCTKGSMGNAGNPRTPLVSLGTYYPSDKPREPSWETKIRG